MSPDKQTNQKTKQRRRLEGLKAARHFQPSHSLLTRLGAITKHKFVCEHKNLDQLRVVILSSCVTINYSLISLYSAIHVRCTCVGPVSEGPFSPFCFRCLCFTSEKHKALIFPDFRHGVYGQCQFASLWQLPREESGLGRSCLRRENKKNKQKKSKATERKCEMAMVHVL